MYRKLLYFLILILIFYYLIDVAIVLSCNLIYLSKNVKKCKVL